jgi:hypothetical protein
MSKGHRDNHKARLKRGPVAFEKKAARRNPKLIRCDVCGSHCRPKLIILGICLNCRNKVVI